MPTADISLYTGAAVVLFCSYKTIQFLLRPYLSNLRYIPGPKNRSIITGHAPEIEDKDDALFFDKYFKQHGPVIKVFGLFQKEFIVTKDFRAVNHVLTHSMDYEKPEEGRKALARFLGDGILVTEGDIHRRQRRIMNPSFSPAMIKTLTPTFYQKVQQLRDIWVSLLIERPDEPLEVLTWLSRTTLDIIGLTGFGYHFNALNVDREPNELNAAFSKLFNADQSFNWFEILEFFFPTLRSIPTKRERGRRTAMKTMNRIGRELLDDRKAAVLGQKRANASDEEDRGDLASRDLLSALVQANLDTGLPDHQRLSDEDVLAQVPTFLVAGHETTSTETMWALFALAQKPNTQQKLRDELLSVQTETPDMDELNALPYLDAVVRETLRVHAAVTAISRSVNKEDIIPLNEPFIDKKGVEHKEIRMKKGDSIILPIRALNISKEVWGEDASEFNPERWEHLPEAAKNMPGVWGHVMTFIGGARGCIGYRFALVEMKVLLFVLVRSFTFEMALPAEKFEKKSFIVTRPYLKENTSAGAQMPLIVKPYSR